MSTATLSQTVPAMPARDVALSAAFYRDRLVGFDVVHQYGGGAIVQPNDAQLTPDVDGNLRTFFERR